MSLLLFLSTSAQQKLPNNLLSLPSAGSSK
jgi:hypothetical protein